MARLIIGHTTESSTTIWVRGDNRYPFAFVTIRGADVDRTQIVDLEERHFFTGTAEFRQLTANSEYLVSVEFGETRSSKEHQRIEFGHCNGRLRTFPTDDSTQPFSFIQGSCNLHSLGVLANPDIAFQNIAEMAISRKASFMIHCGDQIYYDIPNFFKRPDIDEYRDKYLDAWSDSRRTRKFLTMLPQYMILDDHEITNNFANDMDSSASGASPQVFRDIATKVYREFQHIRHPQQYGNQALYYHFNVGKIQFFVLDTRTERYFGARVQTRSDPECDECGERYSGQEVAGELVVAGGHATEILDAAECVLDEVPVTVSPNVIGNRALSVDAAWNDREGSPASQGTAQGIGIIALVGDEIASTFQLRQQHRSRFHIRDIAGCQRKGKWPSKHISQGMELAGLAAA